MRASSRRRLLRAALLLGGGVGLELSPFLAWVRLVDLVHLDLFTLLQLAGAPSRWAWLAVAAGAVVIGSGVAVLYDAGGTAGRVVAGVLAVVVLLRPGRPARSRLARARAPRAEES